MTGKDTTVKMANTCGHCIYGIFSMPKNYYGGSFRAKKAMGMCIVLCNGMVPPAPRDPFNVDCYNSLPEVERRYKRRVVLYDAAKRGFPPSKEVYMQLFEEEYNSRRSGREKECRRRLESVDDDHAKVMRYKKMVDAGERVYYDRRMASMTLEELRKERENNLRIVLETWEEELAIMRDRVSRYYDRWKVNYDWWQENWPLTRRCHRITTCDAFEDNTKKEPVARSVTKGGHSLHKEEE